MNTPSYTGGGQLPRPPTRAYGNPPQFPGGGGRQPSRSPYDLGRPSAGRPGQQGGGAGGNMGSGYQALQGMFDRSSDSGGAWDRKQGGGYSPGGYQRQLGSQPYMQDGMAGGNMGDPRQFLAQLLGGNPQLMQRLAMITGGGGGYGPQMGGPGGMGVMGGGFQSPYGGGGMQRMQMPGFQAPGGSMGQGAFLPQGGFQGGGYGSPPMGGQGGYMGPGSIGGQQNYGGGMPPWMSGGYW